MVHEVQDSAFPAGEFPPGSDRRAGVFVSTQWSVVMRVGQGPTQESHAALERLCRQYWQPLYFYVRRRGYNAHDAQDLTQGFFARLLEKGLIETADRNRGKFRTFLLSALENYLTNEWQKANREKRGGGQEFLPLDDAAGAEAGYRSQAVSNELPDRLYDRRWVQSVLETVMRRLREEFDGRTPGRFDVLKQFLLGERGEIPYAEAAAQLGLKEPALKSAIHRLRLRYGELFAEEIANTVADPADVDGEIRHLLTVLEA